MRRTPDARCPPCTYHGYENHPVIRAQDVKDQAARVEAHGNSNARQDCHDDPGRDDRGLVVVHWGGLRGCRIGNLSHGGTALCLEPRIEEPPVWC